MSRGLATLAEAIAWTRAHWQGRELPYRIHDRAIGEDGAPHMTAAMLRYLMAQPYDMAADANCYRYPMWRALERLRAVPDEPAPISVVVALFLGGWDISRLPAFPERERVVLRSLRQLHGRYEETPIPRVTWIDKSESQRAAEVAA